MKFQEVFRRLNGRDAKPDDVLKFERLTATLETTPGDALLAVLVALDHYETLYASIPAKIEAATTVAVKNAETQAAASVNAAAAKLVTDASKTIQRAIVVREWRNTFIALAACILVAAGMIVHTHHSGYTAGYAAGYSSGSADLVQAARWKKISKRVIGAYLARFIVDARSVTPDVVEEQQAIARMASMIDKSDPADKQLGQWLGDRRDSPFVRAKEELVSVKVESAVRESPSIWRVDWIETANKRDSGKISKKVRMRARLAVYVKPPESTDIFNPLGIYVRNIAW